MKKRRPKETPPAEDPLFRASLTGVTPLAPGNKVALPKARPRPVPVRRTPHAYAADADALSDHVPDGAVFAAGETVQFARPGMQRQVLRQLRRGGAAVEDELDLHGLTTAQARGLLVQFLNRCAAAGIRHVRIIHGKGLRSENREGVLKARVASWLIQREDVLAFREAGPRHGGSGAVLVLLRTAPRAGQ